MNENPRYLIDNLEEVVHHFGDSHDYDDQYERWQYQSIYRVPNRFRNLDESEFTPQVVSLGPYHHGKCHLKEMETHKIRALHKLLKRSGMDLGWWLESLERQNAVEKLKNHYEGLDPVWWEHPKRFMKLMLLDGCFMLDILHTCDPDALSGRGYSENDPIFSVEGMFYMDQAIRKDMLLLENQLPLLLLEMITFVDGRFSKEEAFGLSSNYTESKSKTYIRRLIKKVFQLEGPIGKFYTCLHVLDMYRKSLLAKEKDHMHVMEEQNFNPRNWLINVEERRLAHKVICTIEMLNSAGIHFQPSDTHLLDDISFKDGVISLPFVELDVTNKSLFLNLIAFEKLHIPAGQEVTSYISLMCLVTSTTDVQILSKMHIICNNLGSDHSAAHLFNFLSRNATLLEMDHKTGDILTAIETCYIDHMKHKWKRRFHKWFLSLFEIYFKNPWTFLSVCAATILLGLTIIQTIFTLITFYAPK